MACEKMMKIIVALTSLFLSMSVFAKGMVDELLSNPDINGCGAYLYNQEKKLVFAFPLSTELGYLNIDGVQKGYKPTSSRFIQDETEYRTKKTILTFENNVKVVYEVSKWGDCDECSPIDSLEGEIFLGSSQGQAALPVTGYSGC